MIQTLERPVQTLEEDADVMALVRGDIVRASNLLNVAENRLLVLHNAFISGMDESYCMFAGQDFSRSPQIVFVHGNSKNISVRDCALYVNPQYVEITTLDRNNLVYEGIRKQIMEAGLWL